ncbi:MAG: nuclear transport factor 2 family protein [Acidobacteriota bacterium]
MAVRLISNFSGLSMKAFVSIGFLSLAFLALHGCSGRTGGKRADSNGRGGGFNGAVSSEPDRANSTSNSNSSSGSLGSIENANRNQIVEHPDDIAKGLLQTEDAWNQAYIQKDEAWFQQNLADDYTEIGDTGKTINDKAGAIAEMKADKSTEIVAEISDAKVRVEGNSAIVTGINHVKLKDASGKPIDYKHRFTDTYIKRGDKWLIWADQATRIP